jgi:hypothetical protein
MAKAFPGTALTGNLDGTGDDPEQALLVDTYNHGTLLNALRGSLGAGAWLNLGEGLESVNQGTGNNDTVRLSLGVVAATGAITLGTAHRAKFVDYTGVGTGAQGTFAVTAAGTLGDGWFTEVRNSGTGNLTVDPNSSETIDGATTIVLGPNESALIRTNGSLFRTAGKTVSFATSADMEAGTATTKAPAPATLIYHPLMPKAIGSVNISGGSGVLVQGVNFGTAITKNGTGDFTVPLSITMSGTNYQVVATPFESAAVRLATVKEKSTTAVRVVTTTDAGAAADCNFSLIVFGDL